MAIRTTAATGVIVSLVVFILTTIFLLVLAIVFYAGQAKELEARAGAEQLLDEYATPGERSSDRFKNLLATAGQNRQSVAGLLNARLEALTLYLDGDKSTSEDAIRQRLARLGVDEGGVVRHALEDLDRTMEERDAEIASLKGILAELEEEIRSAQSELLAADKAREQAIAAVQAQTDQYRQAGDQYAQAVARTIDEIEQAKSQFRDEYREEIERLQEENDELTQDQVDLMARIAEFQEILSRTRIGPKDPALLVDGRVIELAGTHDQVFINLGLEDRIVLGMTFEVYDDASQLRPDARTGEVPRGKGSLQIIKVGQRTSTAKITASVPSRPVVRGDVIANAIYDPDYQFKFLVHGMFDVDGDGRASESEAEYLRSRVEEWGGAVVRGDTIPGDLDFLVLGVAPTDPGLPPGDASDLVVQDYMRRKRSFLKYKELYEQARRSQIPVLNVNRLSILTGATSG